MKNLKAGSIIKMYSEGAYCKAKVVVIKKVTEKSVIFDIGKGDRVSKNTFQKGLDKTKDMTFWYEIVTI